MRLLVDTHAYLWFRAGSPQLSNTAKASILDPANTLYLSVASCWELPIKHSIGRLKLSHPLAVLLQPQVLNIALLDISTDHLLRLAMLPPHHRDPFDRLLVAQCLVEKFLMVGADSVMDQYGIQRLW